ncbi:xanthine dehydrogenase accessory protein XdhC [Pantoea agglomerans]|uniref:Xanthine dehydrogenase accessory protein XdhC n=1 Tax=Enterobacter agglomerans TaxID=549 RepID=A0A379AFT4_ENTAG|nr:xanthine dehydrogenase accessory protein XdhC [Pantoea agglomerans]
MLQSGATAPHTEDFSLGARLGQCCGGKTTLLFEPLLQAQPEIYLFGAGHVGQALVNLLSTLPCHINWIDSRPAQFSHVPAGVVTLQPDDPLRLRSTGTRRQLLHHHDPSSSPRLRTVRGGAEARRFPLCRGDRF